MIFGVDSRFFILLPNASVGVLNLFLCQFCHCLYLHPNQFQVLCGIFSFRIGESVHIIQEVSV